MTDDTAGKLDTFNADRGEVRQAMMAAHDEIMNLRRRVADLEPRAHAYDTLAQFARLTVNQAEQGFSMDAAWRLKALLERDMDANNGEKGQPEND